MTEEEFLAIFADQPSAPPPLEYRLYYDDNGYPLFYSTEQLPGNYIVVDRDMFIGGPKHIRVHDGKIVVYQITFGKKLVPSEQGQTCNPHDISVVVAPDQPHVKWNLQHEEPLND